ncbi:MAG: lysylphosphatidylglycerol synthase domain-containing protein [Siphonobacter sp.]
MQNNVNYPAFRRFFLYLLRWGLPVLIGWIVWKTLQAKKQDLGEVWNYLQAAFSTQNSWWLILTLALTILNYSIETCKWQALACKLEPMSFLTALKGVLAGQSLGFVSQANVGDLAGKMGFMQSKNRLNSIGAFLLGSTIQFLVTIFAGTLAYTYFLIRIHTEWGHWFILAALWFSILVTIWLLLLRDKAAPLLEQIAWLASSARFFRVLETYEAKNIWYITGLASLRFLTYSSQFLLVLHGFGVSLALIDQLTVVWLLFLVKSIVPAFSFLSDLGIRTFSTLYFFGFYEVNPALVTSASLMVWMMNILIPVLVGALFVIQLRYLKGD